jgi:streptogramin lyase
MRKGCVQILLVAFTLHMGAAGAAATLQGQVLDANGQPVAQAAVLYTRPAGVAGANVVTVFSDASGKFRFPDTYAEARRDSVQISTRVLGYRLADVVRKSKAGAQGVEALDFTLLMAREDNQSAVAPASAWLNRITSRADKAAFVQNCIDCHQVPAIEQRNFAAAIADQHAADPAVARTESWKYIVKYMNYLSTWEFSRGSRSSGEKIDANAAYSVKNGDQVVKLMTTTFTDRLDHIGGYQWGAPLLANARTTIWEYEIPHPNAVREAMLLGNPRQLWIADVSANRMFTVDIATGKRGVQEVPSSVLMSPHSMHRDHDGNLWVTPLFNSVVAYRNLGTGQWKTWRLKTPDGKSPGIHDLSFGADHELLTDDKGRIWYSDIGNSAVGYFDPKDGAARIWTAPQSANRPGRIALYGLSMTKNRKEVWYSQLGNGMFGGFDIDKQQFIGPFQLASADAGPRRISIGDDDVLYMALYGTGQIAMFDTKARKMIGTYDLPDTGSAPYTTTWDPVRKVVWVGTSNGDVIYRFDPRTKKSTVLPLPRDRAFLRMIDVDPKTGVLITSYANIVDIVQGPRMALIVDPGDDVYPERFGVNGNTPRTAVAK